MKSEEADYHKMSESSSWSSWLHDKLHSKLAIMTEEGITDAVGDHRAEELFKVCDIYHLQIITFLGKLVSFCMFIYVFTTTYLSATQTQKFIALDPASGNCVTVALPATEIAIADYNGNWKGSLDFIKSYGMYKFDLYQFGSDKDLEDTTTVGGVQYDAMLDEWKTSLLDLADKATNRDLVENLVIWCQHRYIHANTLSKDRHLYYNFT